MNLQSVVGKELMRLEAETLFALYEAMTTITNSKLEMYGSEKRAR